MKINLAEAGLAVFCVLFLGLNVVHFIAADELGKENAALSAELAETRAELAAAKDSITFEGNRISGLKLQMETADNALEAKMDSGFVCISTDLNATKARVTDIEEEFGEFQEQYIDLQAEYQQKVEEYAELMDQMEDFEADLQEKMYWYTENADFGGETKGFLSRMKTKCIDGNTLNMPCVTIVLENRSFRYLSEGKDYIKSLDEFEKDKGGDCEDWSIFMKAIINELEEEEGIDELALVKHGTAGYFEVFEDDGVTYYYTDEAVYVDVENLSVACFPVGGGYGHCALVSDNVLFEPQEGSYLSEVYWDDDEYLIKKGGFIEVLIDNQDISIYEGEKWISYSYFIEKIGQVIEEK